MRRAWLIVATVLVSALVAARPVHAQTLDDVTNAAVWGETSSDLLRHFGHAATALPRPLDFGDSYVDVVLRHVPLGGYYLIAYFQMDKATGRLKRIQLERPRHSVNPPVFRAVAAALDSAYGVPENLCGVRSGPTSGYQEAAERIWVRDGEIIRAIFRDTTIQAFEGCIGTVGPCGLTGQLLVRISPSGADGGECPVLPRRP
jgi:hypothetical protein